MSPIEFFAWTLSSILGIGFIISLVVVSRKPRYIAEMEHKKPDPLNKMNAILRNHD
jgi:hypothetical protein